MFSPVDYVSISKAQVDYYEWFYALVRHGMEVNDYYGLKGKNTFDINRFTSHRSTLDLHYFVSDCRSASICSPGGVVLRIDTLSFLEQASTRWDADWFPEDAKSYNFDLLFFEQETYLVTCRRWTDFFSDLYKANIIGDWAWTQERAEAITQFEGWSLCISEEDSGRIPEHIAARMGLGSDAVSELKQSHSPDQGRRSAGRPRLRKAYEEFARMGFCKGSRSWEQLSQHIAKKTGEKPHPRTLRDWVDTAPSKTPPRK